MRNAAAALPTRGVATTLPSQADARELRMGTFPAASSPRAEAMREFAQPVGAPLLVRHWASIRCTSARSWCSS
jgi:hypothetical protein